MSNNPRSLLIADIVRSTRPKLVVELGTGDGATSSEIMAVLPLGSKFVTINWPNPPSGDNPSKYLMPWFGDERLELVCGDTRNEADRIDDGSIDLLYMDSTHTYDCAMAEWETYRPKLMVGAIVIVDDLDHNDMRRFWDYIPYSYKTEAFDGCIGVFKYEPV